MGRIEKAEHDECNFFRIFWGFFKKTFSVLNNVHFFVLGLSTTTIINKKLVFLAVTVAWRWHSRAHAPSTSHAPSTLTRPHSHATAASSVHPFVRSFVRPFVTNNYYASTQVHLNTYCGYLGVEYPKVISNILVILLQLSSSLYRISRFRYIFNNTCVSFVPATLLCNVVFRLIILQSVKTRENR